MATEDLTRLLIEFYEKFSSWEQGVVRETGLTPAQMHTLEILGSCGDLRMKDLAERLGVTTGSLTVLADRLEEAGFVARRPHESDRRSIVVGLTPEGEKHFHEHHALHLRLTEEMTGSLSSEERALFPEILRKISAHL